jgi:hypothetical protein
MTEIQNPKHAQDIEELTVKTVLVIEYLPGGILVDRYETIKNSLANIT